MRSGRFASLGELADHAAEIWGLHASRRLSSDKVRSTALTGGYRHGAEICRPSCDAGGSGHGGDHGPDTGARQTSLPREWSWRIIDASRDPDGNEDADAQLNRLRAALNALADQNLIDFIGLYGAMHDRLYAWRLWAAAHLINGGCSDDGFVDFRAWLIAQGRAVAERAAADPDGLADLAVEPDSASFEEFGYVMSQVFQARSNGAYPTFRTGVGRRKPDGPEWRFDFDDGAEMRARLPRLAALSL